MSSDYISRQMAIDEAYPIYIDGESFDVVQVETLMGMPSADAVEAVRCKDCKYFDSGTDEDGKLFFKCLGWVYGGTSEDDFCSHGERRDG